MYCSRLSYGFLIVQKIHNRVLGAQGFAVNYDNITRDTATVRKLQLINTFQLPPLRPSVLTVQYVVHVQPELGSLSLSPPKTIPTSFGSASFLFAHLTALFLRLPPPPSPVPDLWDSASFCSNLP